jgi:biopolymer transport protein TolR
MQFGSHHDQLMSDINVTPFVDVMLVLLIIFMVTAPMMVQGVDVDLPTSASKALKGSEDRLIICSEVDSKIFINDQIVSIEFLTQKLDAILENFDKKNVYLRADKNVSYGIVVNVISKIKKAGIDSLGMITLPDTEDKS